MKRFLAVHALVYTLALSMVCAQEIAIKSLSVKTASMDPLDSSWTALPGSQIPLYRQGFTAPTGGGSVKEVRVKAVNTDGELFLLLEWDDATRDSRTGLSGKFSDGCAVQVPVKENDMPSPFMGGKGHPVNIWYWRASALEPDRYDKAYADFHRGDAIENEIHFDSRSVQTLLAEGFGTLTSKPGETAQGSAAWKEGKWSVVLKSKLGPASETALRNNAVVPVSFAVWDGSGAERDGIKSLSFWQSLVLGSGKLESASTAVEKGKRHFQRYGCEICHGPGGAGEVASLNAQGGKVPPIDALADGFTEDEVKEIVRKGRVSVPEDDTGPLPYLHMYPWDTIMDESEINELVKFLFTISSKSDTWK